MDSALPFARSLEAALIRSHCPLLEAFGGGGDRIPPCPSVDRRIEVPLATIREKMDDDDDSSLEAGGRRDSLGGSRSGPSGTRAVERKPLGRSQALEVREVLSKDAIARKHKSPSSLEDLSIRSSFQADVPEWTGPPVEEDPDTLKYLGKTIRYALDDIKAWTRRLKNTRKRQQ